MLRFRRMRSLQKFAAVHASVSNHFNQKRSLSSRDIFKVQRTAALTEWWSLVPGKFVLTAANRDEFRKMHGGMSGT